MKFMEKFFGPLVHTNYLWLEFILRFFEVQFYNTDNNAICINDDPHKITIGLLFCFMVSNFPRNKPPRRIRRRKSMEILSATWMLKLVSLAFEQMNCRLV